MSKTKRTSCKKNNDNDCVQEKLDKAIKNQKDFQGKIIDRIDRALSLFNRYIETLANQPIPRKKTYNISHILNNLDNFLDGMKQGIPIVKMMYGLDEEKDFVNKKEMKHYPKKFLDNLYFDTKLEKWVLIIHLKNIDKLETSFENKDISYIRTLLSEFGGIMDVIEDEDEDEEDIVEIAITHADKEKIISIIENLEEMDYKREFRLTEND